MQDILLQNGALGVVVLALAIAVIFLFRQNIAIQDKRHEEMKLVGERFHNVVHENTKSLEELARASERNTQALSELRLALERINRDRGER